MNNSMGIVRGFDSRRRIVLFEAYCFGGWNLCVKERTTITTAATRRCNSINVYNFTLFMAINMDANCLKRQDAASSKPTPKCPSLMVITSNSIDADNKQSTCADFSKSTTTLSLCLNGLEPLQILTILLASSLVVPSPGRTTLAMSLVVNIRLESLLDSCVVGNLLLKCLVLLVHLGEQNCCLLQPLCINGEQRVIQRFNWVQLGSWRCSASFWGECTMK